MTNLNDRGIRRFMHRSRTETGSDMRVAIHRARVAANACGALGEDAPAMVLIGLPTLARIDADLVQNEEEAGPRQARQVAEKDWR